MRGWTKAVLLVALACAAAGACARTGEIASPDDARPRMDGSASGQDSTVAEGDSSSGRWGGFIGSGG